MHFICEMTCENFVRSVRLRERIIEGGQLGKEMRKLRGVSKRSRWRRNNREDERKGGREGERETDRDWDAR